MLHLLQDHSYYIYYKYSPWSYENPNPFHRLFWEVDEGKFFFASAATIVIPAFVATLLFCFYHMVERYRHLLISLQLIHHLTMSGLQTETISGNSSFSPDFDFFLIFSVKHHFELFYEPQVCGDQRRMHQQVLLRCEELLYQILRKHGQFPGQVWPITQSFSVSFL